jgi:hypothetical protein
VYTLQRKQWADRVVRQAQAELPYNASIEELRDAGAAARVRARAALDNVELEVKRLRALHRVCAVITTSHSFSLLVPLVTLCAYKLTLCQCALCSSMQV